MTAPFVREERYIVIKRKHLNDNQEAAIRATLAALRVGTVECVAVESDWPEYETVWGMIEARVNGRPTQPSGEDVPEGPAYRNIRCEKAIMPGYSLGNDGVFRPFGAAGSIVPAVVADEGENGPVKVGGQTFGPPVPVHGKRPSWFQDECDILVQSRYGSRPNWNWYVKRDPALAELWPSTTDIRLPAEHPHYATITSAREAIEAAAKVCMDKAERYGEVLAITTDYSIQHQAQRAINLCQEIEAGIRALSTHAGNGGQSEGGEA